MYRFIYFETIRFFQKLMNRGFRIIAFPPGTIGEIIFRHIFYNGIHHDQVAIFADEWGIKLQLF